MELEEDLSVELSLMHKIEILTVLPFSKYASPIFAQKKPSGKIRLPVDLKKMKILIADDYTNNNHEVITLSDAAQHLATKPLFCKFDCSQAYHCLQMVYQRSVEMLASSMLAELLPTKKLHKISADLCLHFQVWCVDPFVKNDERAQFMDDIGIAANNAMDPTRNIRAVVKCIWKAGLKLIIEKFLFGVRQVELLGRTIIPEWNSL